MDSDRDDAVNGVDDQPDVRSGHFVVFGVVVIDATCQSTIPSVRITAVCEIARGKATPRFIASQLPVPCSTRDSRLIFAQDAGADSSMSHYHPVRANAAKRRAQGDTDRILSSRWSPPNGQNSA